MSTISVGQEDSGSIDLYFDLRHRAAVEQAGNRAHKIAEKTPCSGHGSYLEHDPVEMDDKAQQIEIERSQRKRPL